MEGEAKKSSTTTPPPPPPPTTAHVLVFPYPIQGHINPMLQFSKRLASKGLKVTHITTFTLSKSLPPQPESDLIQTRPIFDGLKEGGKIENHEAYLEIFQRVMPQSLVDVIEEYKKTSDPVKFIVYDCLLPWVLDLARKVGIDGAPFYTQTAAVHSIHYHVYQGALGTPIEGSLVSMPSMPLLRVDDMPSLIANPVPYPAINRLNINQSSNFDKANLSFINTIDMLEDQVVKWMKKQWPIKTIGPAIPSMYLDKRLEDDKDYGLSMFKPETETCIRWLDARETGSVVYVSMGSLSSLRKEQMEEMAMGLENCNKYFLWVVRASEKNKLPLDFQEKTSENGLIVNWCPQLEVLAHRALSCFVTHCGWNSILEAISLGVPMVGFPQWTDQPTNAKYLADVWRIGVRINRNEQGIATRKEIESCILEVMEGERAKEIKSNAKKWRRVIRKAMEEGGSSDKNIEEFVAKMLSS